MEKREKKSSVLLYVDWVSPLRCLPLDDVGRLFLGILDYTASGENPAFDSPGAAMAWAFIRQRLDDSLERWDDTCRKRREAGRRGADVTNSKSRQQAANPANADFAESGAANPAEHEPEHEPEPEPQPQPVPEHEAAAAAMQEADSLPPLPPSSEGEKANTPEAQWAALGLGEKAGPVIRQIIQEYRQTGIEDGVIVAAMQEAAAYQVKSPAAYLRTILARCQAEGILTAAAWQARKRRAAGGSKRVDRAEPSGNDFLADALTRPRRHKRNGI